MRLGSNIILNRKAVAASGITGLVLLFAIFSLPNLLAASLGPKQAEKWIRQYLKQHTMGSNMEQLKAAGLNTPDEQIAKRWQADLNHIDQMEFISIEIRHFLVAPPTSSTRIFMVKAVIRDSDKNENIRYFSLSASNRFFDFFWVNEHSKWKWFLSI
jgi:phage-related protein